MAALVYIGQTKFHPWIKSRFRDMHMLN